MPSPTENRTFRSDRSHKPAGSLLVWDADPLSLLATAGALHSAGHQCICARNAAAATEAVTHPSAERPSVIIADVGKDAPAVLETLAKIRQTPGAENIPAVLIAEVQWSGLEKRIETLAAPTRCLFKPIDPQSMIAVVDALLWMPALEQAHRRKGTRPTKSGWVSL